MGAGGGEGWGVVCGGFALRIISEGLGWSGGLGVGRGGVWFAVGAPYGSALVAMATRDGR